MKNHREREKGNIVYPVYSRRSNGLSIGVNLYPDKKFCTFNCPYCEVFPFASNAVFSLDQMEDDLKEAIASAQEQNIQIKDICFSGNGEPTISPAFTCALEKAENIRKKFSPSSELVIITNGTGLSQPEIFSALKDAAANPSVNIWLKLDAGTQKWYEKINRSPVPFERHIEKIKEFASCASVTIQTMICGIENERPCDTEIQAWIELVCQLAERSGNIRKVQLYGKARPAPEDPHAFELPSANLEDRAGSLQGAFAKKKITVPVEVYL